MIVLPKNKLFPPSPLFFPKLFGDYQTTWQKIINTLGKLINDIIAKYLPIILCTHNSTCCLWLHLLRIFMQSADCSHEFWRPHFTWLHLCTLCIHGQASKLWKHKMCRPLNNCVMNSLKRICIIIFVTGILRNSIVCLPTIDTKGDHVGYQTGWSL